MTSFFCDSSGVVKRYVSEVGSSWILNITDPKAGNIIIVSRITGVEVASALWRKVREGVIAPGEARNLMDTFLLHFHQQYLVMEVTDGVVNEAIKIIERYGLRSYDVIQLATAKLIHIRRQITGLPPLIFVSDDEDLLIAAQAEGLKVENPNRYP